MSEWINKSEEIITSLDLPFKFERYQGTALQLPDTYIVYFLVDDPGKTWANGFETSHVPRIQVSLFYRDNKVALTIPDQIEAAFMAANFMRVGSGRIPFQEETKHYGWRFDFRYYEGRIL